MKDINILVVEDEEMIREIIKTYAEKEQYMIYEAGTGKEAYELLEEREYQMIILDVMLPDTDGWTILRKVRKEKSIPVIMLTARGEEDDKLLGFDLGADDYVTKPFSAKELMARMKTVLKRNHVVTMGETINLGEISINTSFHQIQINDEELELTPLEYKLLMYFVNNRNMALTREQILNGVWGYDYFGNERTVDTHVKRLRKKIGETGDRIKTIRGIGYRMVVEE
ncbi:MAG: response regulator transcription factor [Clostridia bacterium]|nr:response regulator transcription factor [Clostridia bacterium]